MVLICDITTDKLLCSLQQPSLYLVLSERKREAETERERQRDTERKTARQRAERTKVMNLKVAPVEKHNFSRDKGRQDRVKQ